MIATAFSTFDAGIRWQAERNAREAHRLVEELGAKFDAGDLGAAVPLRRALQARTRFEAVAVAFGADPEGLRTQPHHAAVGERSRTAADGGTP